MQITLNNIDTVLLESNANAHERFFYDKVASKFDCNSSLVDAFMYYVIDEYITEWDEKFVNDPESMLNSLFDGNVLSYVNQLRNDMAHAKNIVVNCYLAYVDIFIGYLNELFKDDSNMSIQEATHEVFYSINDQHLTQRPSFAKLNALSQSQRNDLDYILKKVNLD